MNYDGEHGIDRSSESAETRRLFEHQRRLSDIVRELLASMNFEHEALPEGMRQEFIDALDRVPPKRLKSSDDCPICAVPFLEDPHPLVVRLPCPGSHRFDLECVSKWLKSSSTCPMCRHDFLATKETVVADDEEFDDMYA